jgi:RNA polymerase sigma-70 factor (ECF subfamily)
VELIMGIARFSELIRRVRAGDAEAAAELVNRYEDAIRRAVRFRLGGTRLVRLMDSVDVCQSVLASFFVRAAAGQYDIHEPAQLIKLLVAMARNKVALHARAQARQCRDHRREQPAGDDEAVFVARGPSPSQVVAGQELLHEAARRLTPEERQLIELRKEGHEWADIAQRVGGSAEALRKQLARAVNRVAHELHLDDFGDE